MAKIIYFEILPDDIQTSKKFYNDYLYGQLKNSKRHNNNTPANMEYYKIITTNDKGNKAL